MAQEVFIPFMQNEKLWLEKFVNDQQNMKIVNDFFCANFLVYGTTWLFY